MNAGIAILSAVGAYLLGSISFARFFNKLAAPDKELVDLERPIAGTDLTFREHGIGASAVGNGVSGKAGCLVGFLDMAKVFIPTLVLRLLYPDQPYHLIAASMGMVGHNWPIYYRFRGGHGYSTAYGGALAVDWLGALISAVAGFVIGLFILKSFVFVFIGGLLVLIPWFWFTKHDLWYVAYAVVVNVSFILALVPDIRQGLELQKQMTRKSTLREDMMGNPMGKGLLRMADKYHWRIFD
jgi:glycerol-3-phosphate acyltransferase PlsY